MVERAGQTFSVKTLTRLDPGLLCIQLKLQVNCTLLFWHIVVVLVHLFKSASCMLHFMLVSVPDRGNRYGLLWCTCIIFMGWEGVRGELLIMSWFYSFHLKTWTKLCEQVVVCSGRIKFYFYVSNACFNSSSTGSTVYAIVFTKARAFTMLWSAHKALKGYTRQSQSRQYGVWQGSHVPFY